MLARILDGTLAPADAPSEAEWCALWSSRGVGEHPPAAMAMVGGSLADRLSWVFLSGYQAALRRSFPECPPDGLAAFAVSEDREGKLPGTALVAGGGGAFALSGFKTWVAACDHVRTLVVSTGAGDERRFALVDREADGVTVEARKPGGFLAEMSQGRAGFDAVRVEPDRVIADPSRAASMGVAEPLHVLAALNAFMLSHTRSRGGPASIVGRALSSLLAAGALCEHDLLSKTVALGLVGLDAETQAVAGEFEEFIATGDAALADAWSRDRRLVRMFSAGITRRAEATSGS